MHQILENSLELPKTAQHCHSYATIYDTVILNIKYVINCYARS